MNILSKDTGSSGGALGMGSRNRVGLGRRRLTGDPKAPVTTSASAGPDCWGTADHVRNRRSVGPEGHARLPPERLAHDARDRPPRPRRRAGPPRARRRPRRPPALDRRPRRAAGSRSPTRTATSGSPSTASSSSIPSSAPRSCSPAATACATRCDTEAWVHLYEDHGEGMFERARGQFAVSLWDRAQPHPDPGPRPGRDLPALLRRGATAGCSGARRSRRSWPRAWSPPGPTRGDRPPLHVLLRGDDAGPSSRGSSRCRPGISSRSGRPGRAAAVLGPRLPRRRARSGGSTTRRRWSTSSRPCCSARSSVGCGATCRSSATSAAGSTRRSCWALQLAQRGEAVPRSRSASTGPGPTSGPTRPRRPRGAGLAADDGDDGPAEIADAFPELITAAEGPVLDTSVPVSCGWPARVHEQGTRSP